MEWGRVRTLQQKMGRTRDHVESRILAITDILAPPLGRYRISSVKMLLNTGVVTWG
jgi:hypothetical protein